MRDDPLAAIGTVMERSFEDGAAVRAVGTGPRRGDDGRFRAMVEALPTMVFEADARGGNTWSSEACARYTGLSAAQLAGEGWLQVIHPEDLARCRATWLEALDTGVACTARHRMRRHDGQWRWHLVHAVPLRSATGAIEGWVGSATDIDEMVRAESVLAEQEQRARFMLALTERLRDLADPQAMMDAATDALGAHLAVARVGYGEIDEAQTHITVHRDWHDGRIGSVVGTWRLDDFGPEFLDRVKAGQTISVDDIGRDLRTAQAAVAQAYERIRTRAVLSVPLVKQGRLVAMLFVHHCEPREWTPAEVTLVERTCERLWAAVERARAERALAENEAHLRAVLEALPVGVVIADAEGRFTRVNAAYRALWGMAPETSSWKQYGEWVGFWPETGRRIQAEEWGMARALLRGEVVSGELLECQPFGGGPRRFFLNNAAPVRDGAGRIVGGVVITLDVTEQRAAADELTRRTQELTQTKLRLDVALAAGRMGVWDWSVVTDESRWNHQMFELLGLPGRDEATMPGTLFTSMVHPQDRPAFDATLARALEQGGVYEMEARVIRADGQVRWLIGRGEVLRDDRGRACRVVGVNFDITERKAAEQALHLSEERYRLINRATNDVIWDWNLETNRLDWTDAVQHHFGCTREELGPSIEGWYTGIHPDDRDRVVRGIHAAIEHGQQNWSDEYRFRRGDGSYATFLDRGHIARDAAGRAYRMIGSMLDLSERRRAEEALRESEERFRLMSDAVPQIVWITDAQGRNVFVNRQWADYTGVALDSATAAEITALVIHPRDAAITLERFDEARRNGTTYQVEHRVRSAAGEYRWFLVRAEPYRDPKSGEIVRWFGASIDIHDRKRAEEELRRREQEFRTLADNTPEILSRFDRQMRHLFVNRAIERATGRKPEEFLGKTNRELGMPQALCDAWDEAVLSVFEHRRPRDVEFRFETLSGPRYFSGQVVPEFGPSGEVEHVLGVMGDRTAEKVAVEALQEADRRKDEFLATLAHELRNPLAPIRTGIQILRFTPEVVQAAAKTLETMERQIAHMVRMIDDLLDVSRISRGKVELRRERVALRAVLDSAIEASHPFIDAGRHELTLHLPAKPLCLDGDPTRLAQVIGNLLNNAAKYTPSGGRIELSAEREGDEAVIRVKDNGIGIPAEMLPRVFEMFIQVPQDIVHSQGGLGIGLSLAKRLVEMHEGEIRAESAGPGQGAVFTVRLPLTEQPEAQACGPGVPGPGPGANAPRVLVVDDNVDAAETLAMMLGLLGHDTRTAYDGPDALEAARQFDPAVVFCDIGMPGMDGYEVARRLRGDPAHAPTLLVALTGWGSEEDKRRALEAGFDAHLTKPVDIAAMQQLLAELSQAG